MTRAKDRTASGRNAELAAAWLSLEDAGWLSGRCAEFRARLRQIARLRVFARKEAIYLAGDAPNGMFGVVAGSVHISLPREDGQDFTVYRSGRGFWIGDLAIFAHHARLVSVWAAEETRTVHLPAAALRRLVQENPAFFEYFYDLTYQNTKLLLQVLASFSEESVDRRVARRLLAELDGRGNRERWIAMTQSELSEMLAISMPTMQRCLRRLVRAGLISVGYSRIRVVDRQALLKLCAPEDHRLSTGVN
jgi:CRP-like cAMP-binding protein